MENLDKEKWNNEAKDYQTVFALGISDYNKALLEFWEKENMIFDGCKVIDIGCGVGKYGVQFAKRGYDVTLTDISDGMLKHAEGNMKEFTTPWEVYCCDFNDATGKEPVFSKGFDLSISTMSPAIHDLDTVKKMSDMTNGTCFLARFYDWDQPFRTALFEAVGITENDSFGAGMKDDCLAMKELAEKLGYEARFMLVPYNWADKRTPEETADYMRRHYFADAENADELYEKVMEYSKAHSDESGCITDDVNSTVAWIYWNTKELKND